MSKSLKKIASVALPVGAAFIPGIGPLAAAGLGAAGGLVGGGGLKGALLGGLTSGAGNYLGASNILGGSSMFGPATASQVASAGSTNAALSGLKSSGLAGALKAGGSGISLGNVGTIASGVNSYMTQDDMEEKLLAAQGKAASAYAPYSAAGLSANSQLSDRLSAGFNPGDLTSDPGYQFQLAEGNKALDRRLAASGALDSGAAIKAGQDYGQGLASTTYNDAYNRWLQQNSQLAGQSGQGFGAATGLAGVYDTEGDIQANADVGRTNILSSTLSSLLSGSGEIAYYDANGKPVYKNQGAYAQ